MQKRGVIPINYQYDLPNGSFIFSSGIEDDKRSDRHFVVRSVAEARAAFMERPKAIEGNPDLLPFSFEMTTDHGMVHVPYKEVIGSPKSGRMEYRSHQIVCDYTDSEADLAGSIGAFYRAHDPDRTFEGELQKQMAAAAALGYTSHPPKLWLMGYRQEMDTGMLRMTFGRIGYIEHRIYRQILDRSIEGNTERQAFLRSMASGRGNAFDFGDGLWAMSGGGAWIITGDGYLVLSHRQKVIEIPGTISYTSSGAFERFMRGEDNTPHRAILAEIEEELGIDEDELEDLRLISVGIDLDRCLLQCSFFCTCSLTAAEVRTRHQQAAETASEQNLVFVRRDDRAAIHDLLWSCAFEPGAAASLYRLLQKGIIGPQAGV